ncbi:hypothetical protein [Alicyclobacillus macrosporangiidus]|uniref:Uncharacterized protein n=1 Tax=Alicyclobacillus macrosporangiidus TaxID=392015 RepID=A0A1I7INW6_9BACL|nr:hypothetical protein [Alicyclobacillus macrosporangiidus]SFU74619.1 hypothetical protein SAMN05421543_1077 [Alicyclobacillus macrosporangiidus]
MVETADALLRLAQDVWALEQEGANLSQTWYGFETPEAGALKRLHTVNGQALTKLERLAQGLDSRVRSADDGDRPHLQHAYHLVQELIQSRRAVHELVGAQLDGRRAFDEDLRALGLKERAAAQQARKLCDTLKRIH